MTTAVQITLIICATIISVFLIAAFTPKKKQKTKERN